VPADVIATVRKATDGPVELTLGERHAAFTAGGTTWTTQLIEGDYPPYKGLLRAESPNRWTFEAEALLEAITRTGTVHGEDASPLRIQVDGGKATLCRWVSGVAQVDVTIPVDADNDMAVGANPDYLRRLVVAADSEQVELGLVDHLKPIMVESDRLHQALMPVRLGEPST
jgi:DNA polymerase III subunit beta